MCGIAGIVSHDPGSRIGAALKSIEHRGLDDEGVFISESFGSDKLKSCLGHRRLSIIDTSAAGHQPMLTDDGRYALVLNGEIYNYKQIRSELEAEGVAFFSGSDTEVLLKAFREWNVGCLDISALARWNGRLIGLWRIAPSSVFLTTTSSTSTPCSGIGTCS